MVQGQIQSGPAEKCSTAVTPHRHKACSYWPEPNCVCFECVCVYVCARVFLYAPFHLQASPIAECRGWWGNEGFLRCLPQGEQRGGSQEPASATYTDLSAQRDNCRFVSVQTSRELKVIKEFYTVQTAHNISSLQAANTLHNPYGSYLNVISEMSAETKRKWMWEDTHWPCGSAL